MPVYTSEEVAKHQDESTGIWISYKNGVYDITKFVQMHPGLVLFYNSESFGSRYVCSF